MNRRHLNPLAAVLIAATLFTPSAHGQVRRNADEFFALYPAGTLPRGKLKIGPQTGLVRTDDYDTGFDGGARIGSRVYRDYLQLSTEMHYWSAARDETDIGVFGLQETLTVHVPVSRRLTWYSGLSIGHFSYTTDRMYWIDGVSHIDSDTTTHNGLLFRFGWEYLFPPGRTVFVEMNYGSTHLGTELHITFGMNFFTRLEFLRKKESSGES